MKQEALTPEEMIALLNNQDYLNALKFLKIGYDLNCKYGIRYATAHKVWKCVYTKSKPKRTLFTLECNDKKWSVKANLFHMKEYQEVVESCSENIKHTIRNAYDCKNCSPRCKGGTEFSIDGENFIKCIGCCFYFKDISSKEWDTVCTLLQKENEY